MTLEFDPELIIPNEELSLGEGAVHAWSNWSTITQDHYSHLIDEFSGKFGIDLKVPFKKINKGPETSYYMVRYKIKMLNALKVSSDFMACI